MTNDAILAGHGRAWPARGGALAMTFEGTGTRVHRQAAAGGRPDVVARVSGGLAAAAPSAADGT